MAEKLSISSSELSDDRIMALTVDLCQALNKETEIEARFAESKAKDGAKGEPNSIELILTALTSGTAVALFNVLKSFVDREPSIKVTIKRKDGVRIYIDAKNIKINQIKELITSMK